jgi:prepilin-type processing-associated H-X9-DG protein
MPAATKENSPAAFTLVELLVTGAIVAILAALLLPSLNGGKTQAQAAKCTGNLRQFALAAQMYWDDNQGNTFAYAGSTRSNGTLYWFGWLSQGAEETRAFDPTQAALYPYLGSAVALCPSFDYASSQFKLKASGPTCDYGYNLNFSPFNSQPINVRKLNATAGLALLADAAQVNTFEPPASPRNPMFEEWYYVDFEGTNTSPQPNGQFRHQQRANVVFCDQHVAPCQMLPGSLDPRLPAQNIGWLPPQILTPH